LSRCQIQISFKSFCQANKPALNRNYPPFFGKQERRAKSSVFYATLVLVTSPLSRAPLFMCTAISLHLHFAPGALGLLLVSQLSAPSSSQFRVPIFHFPPPSSHFPVRQHERGVFLGATGYGMGFLGVPEVNLNQGPQQL